MPRNTGPRAPRRGRARTIIASAVLVAAVLTAVFAFTLNSGDDDGHTSASGAGPHPSSTAEGDATPRQDDADPQLAELARRKAGDPFALGKADAPVVMIEYADFQCPFCGQFARETKPELIRDYVDKGVLRIEWRNFPIFGAESQSAAQASWAAARQKRFWQFYDLAYSKPRKKNSGAFSTDKLVAMAKKAGVGDLHRFRTDLDSKAAEAAVAEDTGEGYKLGVTSTPAFLINGQPILGAQPTKIFTDAVDHAAAKAAKEGKKGKTGKDGETGDGGKTGKDEKSGASGKDGAHE